MTFWSYYFLLSNDLSLIIYLILSIFLDSNSKIFTTIQLFTNILSSRIISPRFSLNCSFTRLQHRLKMQSVRVLLYHCISSPIVLNITETSFLLFIFEKQILRENIVQVINWLFLLRRRSFILLDSSITMVSTVVRPINFIVNFNNNHVIVIIIKVLLLWSDIISHLDVNMLHNSNVVVRDELFLLRYCLSDSTVTVVCLR